MASRPHAGLGFTLIELLVVIAIISVIAGLVVPSLIAAREKANIATCQHNLQEIYTFALAYSDDEGTHAFPIGPGSEPRAHESLNVLLAYEPEAFQPKMFVCPSGDAFLASTDDDGRFVLDDKTNGYAWVARRLKNTAMNRPLASDKYVRGYEDEGGVHDGHRGVNVLYTDGSVSFVKSSSLPPDTLLPAGLTR